MAYMMRNGVDFEVDLGSYIGLLRGDGAGRQTSARGKGWHGSGGGTERAHREKYDHATAPCTASPCRGGWRAKRAGRHRTCSK